MENQIARFTRDAEGNWLIAVDNQSADNQRMQVERKGRGPVWMRTGALVGPHPKWPGFWTYERLSKAPTGGNMGHNNDDDSNNAGEAPQPQPVPQPQQQPNADMSQYVTRPEFEERTDALAQAIRRASPVEVVV